MQAFHILYHTDESVLLGAPTGSGKTISAELAMLRVFRAHPGMKVIYIAPLKVSSVIPWICAPLGMNVQALELLYSQTETAKRPLSTLMGAPSFCSLSVPHHNMYLSLYALGTVEQISPPVDRHHSMHAGTAKGLPL